MHFTQNARQSNLKLVLLHILADTLSSVGVIVSAVLVKGKALHVADTVVSLGIATLIVYSVFPFFKNIGYMLLQTTPLNIIGFLGKIDRQG